MQYYALKSNITEENMETANFKLFAQFEFSEVIKHNLRVKNIVDFLKLKNTGEN